jgi:glycogen debranching enzyme
VEVDEILEWEEEARRLRRERADWEFIEKLPPKLKAALKYYVETGDFRVAQQIAGLDFEDFRELLRRAKVPVVL